MGKLQMCGIEQNLIHKIRQKGRVTAPPKGINLSQVLQTFKQAGCVPAPAAHFLHVFIKLID